MMREGEGRGTVDAPGKPAREASFKWRQYTEAEALQRAAIAWGAIWACGLFTILIPLVHFVTVPAALLCGPLVFYFVRKLYAGGIDVYALEGQCPACEAQLKLSASRAWNRRIDLTCLDCGTRLSLMSERPTP